MILDFPLPDAQVDQARQWLAAPGEPVAARRASTVILLRESSQPGHPFDVYMVRRAKTMAHTPGVCAFPGGSVRPDDDDLDVPFEGPAMSSWAQEMGVDAEMAHRHLLTSARETFEESRILLARAADGSTIVNDSSWEDERGRVENHELDFGDVLREHRLMLDFTHAAFRGHWTTPEFLPRRYAVSFFTVLLPAGQEPVLASTEATVDRWDHPQRFLERADAGEIQLVAPTRVHLQELAACSSLEEALTTIPRDVMFAPVEVDGEWRLHWEG